MNYEFLKCDECFARDDEKRKEFFVIIDDLGRIHLECAYCGMSHRVTGMMFDGSL